MMSAGSLNRHMIVERPVTSQDATYGTATTTWQLVGAWWVSALDIIGKEATQDSMRQYTRPCRVRMRYTDKIDPTMRLRLGSRVLQIVGIAEIGLREGLEILAEQYSTTGVSA